MSERRIVDSSHDCAVLGSRLRRPSCGHDDLAVAASGAVARVAGVVFVHGLPARLLIDGGALALAATGWIIVARSTGARGAAPA